jgi:hypothetical protein
VGTWPWPGDTQTDIARRMALSYREELATHCPEAARLLDERFTDWGQRWHVPQPARNLDDYVTVDVAADHVGFTAAAVYKWIHAGQLATITDNETGRLLVHLKRVLEIKQEKRRKRSRGRT